jgi:CRP-like cAMP-binding protein
MVDVSDNKKLEIFKIIKKISIFGGLDEEQIYKILEKSNYSKVIKDQDILIQGNSPQNIYVIIKGEVEIYQELHNKKYKLLTMGEGECFGEVEILGIIPNIASVRTIKDSEFIEIEKRQLHQLLHSDMKIFNILLMNMAREACRRLATLDRDLVGYMEK